MGIGLAWAPIVALLAAAAGTGWLYLARGWSLPTVGPGVSGALPLQQLNGDDTQPLLHVIVAWVPAGIVGALLLARVCGAGGVARAIALGVFGLLWLGLAGAVSDATAVSEVVGRHLASQLSRPGVWAEAGLLMAGALMAIRARPRRPARRRGVVEPRVRSSAG